MFYTKNLKQSELFWIKLNKQIVVIIIIAFKLYQYP